LHFLSGISFRLRLCGALQLARGAEAKHRRQAKSVQDQFTSFAAQVYNGGVLLWDFSLDAPVRHAPQALLDEQALW
jgi:hypothetical protein